MRLSNTLAYALNGAGDLGGYKIDVGLEKQLFKNTYLIVRVGLSDTRSTEFLLTHYSSLENDVAISLTGAINREIKLTRWLSVSPEVGFVLRSHHWTIVTGPNFYIIHYDRVIPPSSSAQWRDNAIGYHVQIPFVFRTGQRTAVTLFSEYENDNFGYSFFSVGVGFKIGVR